MMLMMIMIYIKDSQFITCVLLIMTMTGMIVQMIRYNFLLKVKSKVSKVKMYLIFNLIKVLGTIKNQG